MQQATVGNAVSKGAKASNVEEAPAEDRWNHNKKPDFACAIAGGRV